jgi:hypothetical protein
MKKTVKALVVTFIATLMVSSSSIASQQPSHVLQQNPLVLLPTKMVTITPPYGFYVAPIRERLSKSEVDIVRRLQNLAVNWESASPPPVNLIRWHIEPSALNSRTVAISIEAFHAARAFLSVPLNDATKSIVVIIGRTQEFLRQQVNALGCQPNLALYQGEYIMGATICNRSVIVINLTGYLFLRTLTLPITSAMEQRKEPAFSAISYKIVDRNLSGLAHEWTHVARNRLTNGFIPDNEPAWFREGLAEIVSGLARIKASKGKMTYMDFHIIRLRRFSDWPNLCNAKLFTYRSNSPQPGGCEYLRGAAALELLIANYGGLQRIVNLYSHMSDSSDFLASFQFTYGMTLSQFEARADNYARYISQAANLGK